MLRTNLATRPFYNERGVYLAIAVVAAFVAALTMFNASRLVTLSRQNRALVERTDQTQRRVDERRAAAERLQAGLGPQQLAAVSSSARQANQIIERRLFSWTELLNQFEATLPDEVRITTVRPKAGQPGPMTLTIGVVGRGVEDVDAFMDALERTGAFADTLSVEEGTNEEGALVAVIETRYLQGGAGPEARP